VESLTFRFSYVVQQVSAAARRLGLEPPGFRAPPRLAGVDRSIRRPAAGGAVIAVRIHGRGFDAVVADVIEGVIVAAGLRDEPADAARIALRAAVEGLAQAA
jgi:hypothetical protein